MVPSLGVVNESAVRFALRSGADSACGLGKCLSFTRCYRRTVTTLFHRLLPHFEVFRSIVIALGICPGGFLQLGTHKTVATERGVYKVQKVFAYNHHLLIALSLISISVSHVRIGFVKVTKLCADPFIVRRRKFVV